MGSELYTPSIHSLEALLANIDGMVYRCLADKGWAMEFVSQGALALTGLHPGELLGADAMPFKQLIVHEDRERVRRTIQDALAQGRRFEVEYRIRKKDGALRWVCERGAAVQHGEQDPVVLEGIIQDITRHKQATEALLEAERRYRSIFENAIEGIYQSTRERGYLAVNPALARIYGYDSPAQLIEGLRDIGTRLYVDEGRRQDFMEIMERHGVVSNFESRVYRKDGSIIWISENARAVRNEAGEVLFYEGTVEDITQRRINEEEIRFRATHDPLTRLANRALLQERLGQAIDTARRYGKCVATVFLDLDKFKYVNDSLGHQVGDDLLVAIAERLRRCVRDGDTVARLGGDEFVVVLANLAPEHSAQAVRKTVQRLLAEVARPWVAQGLEIQVTCSVGISLFPADGGDALAMLKQADTAMFEAKRLGRNNSQFFTEQLDGAALQRLQLISSLRRALDKHELVLHYQPKYALDSGHLVGAEALLRWHRPGEAALPTSELITLAEEAGLMDALGEWVLRNACAQARAWQAAGHAPMPVSVNVSPLQLERESVVAQVAQALQDTGLAPGCLEIEITESGMMRSVEKSKSTLLQLKALGVRLSIDDFGTGYSSLSHLKRLPLDALKIDRSFVHNIAADRENASIVKAVISLAHSLELSVVAEGVETEEEYKFLQGLRCDEIQGYYKGRPVPAPSFARAHFGSAPGDAGADARQARAGLVAW